MATTADADAATGSKKNRGRDRRMSLSGHLKELRRRLFICAIAIVVAMIGAYFLTEYILDFLTWPIETVREKLGDDFSRLTFSAISDAFNIRMRLSFAVGLVLAAPIWIWQIWAFIMPGLKKREIIYSLSFLGAAIPLFFGGVVTAVLVMPNLIVLMSEFVPEGIAASQIYDANTYLDFILKLILTVGIAYVLPLFLVGLNLAGVMRAKTILKGWRIALVACLVFGMLASPPSDLLTMCILAAILFLLYMAAGVVSWFFDRAKRRRNPELFVEV